MSHPSIPAGVPRLAALPLGLLLLAGPAGAEEALRAVAVHQAAVVFRAQEGQDELGQVAPGQLYTRLRSAGSRIAIGWRDGQEGWLERSALADRQAPIFAMVLDRFDVRQAPAPTSGSRGSLLRGATVVPQELRGEWVRISFAGGDGWLERSALRGPLDLDSPAADPGAAPLARGAPGAAASAGPGEPAAGEPLGRGAAETTRGPVSATSRELEVMARIIKGEAGVCSYEGKVAVGAVILNRVRSPRFPNDIVSVCHQPAQFSCYNRDQRARLYDGPIPADCLAAAREALAGRDPVGGAEWYFNPYLVRPAWARSLVLVRRIGSGRQDTHDFYRTR